jgi:hypothetical protein
MLFLPSRKQRRFRRHWMSVPVDIRDAESRMDGVSINISEGGMYLFAATNLPVGSRIELEFRPPDKNQPRRVCGVIRRRALYLYGIEFLHGEGDSTCAELMAQADNLPDRYSAL